MSHGYRNRSNLLYRDKHGALVQLDSVDVRILKELLDDATVSNSSLSARLKIPPLDIRGRRKHLEKKSILKSSYAIDVSAFGWRVGDIYIDVEKGMSEQIASQIFDIHHHIEEVTIRINSTANVTARVYYQSSKELHQIQERIKEMP